MTNFVAATAIAASLKRDNPLGSAGHQAPAMSNSDPMNDIMGFHMTALADFPADIDLGIMEALLPMVLEEKTEA